MSVPFADGFIAPDHGKEHVYLIAADELGEKQTDGRFSVKSANAAKSLKNSNTPVETRPVLYPRDEKRSEGNRRLLTEKIIVKVQPGADTAALAKRQGIVKWKPLADAGQYIFFASSARSSVSQAESLRTDQAVQSADLVLARMQNHRGRPNDPLFKLQWHLYNTGQDQGLRGIDTHVVGIWGNFRYKNAGYRGRGVIIGIVDDGVQYTHPDLQARYNQSLDYDWNDNTPFDPTPSEKNQDYHGTSVAGVAAAQGGNKIGVSGVAPQATITGFRLIAGYVDDSQEAEAFRRGSSRIAIKSNSWGPYDDGQTMEAPGPLASQALAAATKSGRYGRGTIFVWAAGNGRTEGDNSNYDGYANSIYTIAVTAIDNRGKATYYGEGGANVLIGAPSDNYSGGIVTTDLVGYGGYNYSGASGELADRNYTQTFGGTSSATPVVSGTVALMLQRNRKLGWRDVQEILIRSARKNDPKNVNWIVNGAGFHFNEDFGAGLVDAGAAVRLAGRWTNLGPLTSQTQSSQTVGTIPDGGNITRTFSFPSTQRVEHVTVKLNVTHAKRGQLHITLKSPSGTISELATKHNDPNADIDWTYMSVRNWGENSGGVWTLKIEDLLPGTIGTLNSAEVTLFGTNKS